MKDFTFIISNICNKLADEFEPGKKEKAMMAYRKYNEYLLRLESRYIELLRIEKAKELINLEELKNQGRSLENLQLEFVDKTEAFHQQVYATISAFVLLLSHVTNHKYSSQLPIRSVTKFLKYMSDKSDDETFKSHVNTLQNSVAFRAKFIDHPQQHALHDWMTFSYGHGTCIIYFIRTGNNVYAASSFDPYASDYKPPVDHSSFYVSPLHGAVFSAVKYFSQTVLENIIKTES